MRNRFICLFLALVLALPLVLASCSSETALDDTAAPVYTLYCITDDSTTAASITQVEYELNRTLFYRIGSIVKLVLVTADEYQELIDSKMLEVSDFINGTNLSGTNESNEKQVLTNHAKLTDSAAAAGYKAMSGEAILDDLANGIDIELETPRLDLFLVTDYNSYLKMAEHGDLAALDTVLNHEAKAIKSYVHSSFFNAAKVNNKTYGVPCNTIIGEYTYVVFDKDVLTASGAAQETLYSMEDLSDYLALVKEQNPDIIPLANSVTPYTLSFMFEDGFAAYVNQNGYVRSTYTDDTVNKYFTMLSRYSALGYFQNAAGQTGEDADAKFAVKFMTGTKEQMALLAEQNNYVYNQYSVPVATSENSIDSIYCVSSLCPSSWQTDVMKILSALYTDVALQNTFLYGIENTNYHLEGNQVVRLNNNYRMNYAHTGNCFIAYTDKDAGDSLNKWEDARNQNIDAQESKTIGFTYSPKTYKFITGLDENGKEIELELTEPDYQSILWEIIQPHYQKLLNGTAIAFDYEAAREAAETAALESIYNTLLATYTLRLRQTYTSGIEADIIAQYGEQLHEQAFSDVKEILMEDINTNSRKRRLKTQLGEENPDASDEELDAMMERLLQDKDALWAYREIVRKDSQWQDAIEDQYETLVSERVESKTEEVINSAEYLRALNNIPQSEKFQEEYNYSVEVEVADTVNTTLDNQLSSLIKEYCNAMIEECNTALETAIDAFAEQYAAATKATYDYQVYQQMKLLFPGETDEQLARRTKEQQEFIAEHISDLYNDKAAAFESALKRKLAKDFPDLSDEEISAQITAQTKLFEDLYTPLYTDFYNGKTLALYQIGYAAKDALTSFTGASDKDEDKPDDGDTEPSTPVDPDAPVAGRYESYYEFAVIKFQDAYYEQFGSPIK